MKSRKNNIILLLALTILSSGCGVDFTSSACKRAKAKPGQGNWIGKAAYSSSGHVINADVRIYVEFHGDGECSLTQDVAFTVLGESTNYFRFGGRAYYRNEDAEILFGSDPTLPNAEEKRVYVNRNSGEDLESGAGLLTLCFADGSDECLAEMTIPLEAK